MTNPECIAYVRDEQCADDEHQRAVTLKPCVDRRGAQSVAGAEALVLAGGAGRRFGGGKLLAPWRGRPLILAAVETALRAPVERVIVVLGCEAEAMAAALEPVRGVRLVTVVNERWNDGISASLKVGLDHLAPATGRVVVFLGDMPVVPVQYAGRLLAALTAGAPAALVRCGGQPAHPVAFSRALFEPLRSLTGDRGGRYLLERTQKVAFIESTDDASQFDVDRPSDLQANRFIDPMLAVDQGS